METLLTFNSFLIHEGKPYLLFTTKDGIDFKVKSFKNGILHIAKFENASIEEISQIVVGLFEKKSNLFGINEIILDFDDLSLNITKLKATYDKIYGLLTSISKNTEIQFKDENAKEKWNIFSQVPTNDLDIYGNSNIKFIQRWARLMQSEMENGAKMTSSFVKNTMVIANLDNLSDYECKCAARILCYYWMYGDQLKRALSLL